MQKIFKSLLTLGVVAMAVFGSAAYFSDTETSSGNVFQAGAIDLKVDSEAHYNGLICRDGKWVNDCLPEGPELMVNGGFEAPEVTNGAGWEIFNSILGWTIEWESSETTFNGSNRPSPALQEYHEGVNGWGAAEGDQYAELDTDWDGPGGPLNNEPARVRIYQDIATTVGTKYQLSYHYSPRPGASAADNELLVRVGGSQVASHSQAGGGNTNWTKYTYEFIATAGTTRIEFAAGGQANSVGVFLDGVSFRGMRCNSTFTELEGKECSSSWDLTDLGPTHKFWMYSDVKPGDWGENTISLHVYDNPAYACMMATNLQDGDPIETATEPEQNPNEGNDQTFGEGQGELSKNIHMFMWHDDGDNIWESGETKITQSPVWAITALNNQVYPLAVPDDSPIYPGTTKYVGMAWCAGTMTVDDVNFNLLCNGQSMGNIAQTDLMSVDFSFYVEQARHNEEFECPQPQVEPEQDNQLEV